MEKIKYIQPKIEWVKLDNEISLALESTPPTGPYESNLAAPEYIYNDPFKSTNC
ncbi:MAG: hypothetical protein PHS59_13095 [Paludibacter sp.]|nr:hypothetical protein [Paludibacter sp.]